MRLLLAAARSPRQAALCSYPKSGRTWLRYGCASYFALTRRAEVPIDFATMFRLVPNLSLSRSRGLLGLDGILKRDVPLLMSSHDAWSEERFGQLDVVFLVRDPKDVLVSDYFHETRHLRRFDGSLSYFLRSERGAMRLARYLQTWAAGLQRHRHVLVSYERMHADFEGELASVLGFLGMEAEPGLLQRAAEAARFDRMLEVELESGIPDMNHDRQDPDARRMRKGLIGGASEVLLPDDAAWLDAYLLARLSDDARRMLEACRLKRAPALTAALVS